MAQHLRTLGPRHHAAVRLKLDGASGGEIAETLGVETRTVYLWMDDPLVKQELARQGELIRDEFVRRLSRAALVGISQLTEAVQLPIEGPITPEQKLAFIREALDRFERCYGPALRREPGWLRSRVPPTMSAKAGTIAGLTGSADRPRPRLYDMPPPWQ